MFRSLFSRKIQNVNIFLYLGVVLTIFLYFFHEFFFIAGNVSVDEEFYVSYGLILFITYINVIIVFRMSNIVNILLLDNFVMSASGIITIYRGLLYSYYILCSYLYLYKELVYLFKNLVHQTEKSYIYQFSVLSTVAEQSTSELVKIFFSLFLSKFTESVFWFLVSLEARILYFCALSRVLYICVCNQDMYEQVLAMNHSVFKNFIYYHVGRKIK